MPIIFAPAEDRTRDPPHANPTLYRVAIHKAVQMCYTSILNTTTTYSGIHRGYLPPSVACSFQICKFFFLLLLFFHITARSFRVGPPVYSLTFVYLKRRDLDR